MGQPNFDRCDGRLLVRCRFSRLALVSDERIHRRRCSVCSDDSGKQYEG